MEGSIQRYLLVHTSWTTCSHGKFITQTNTTMEGSLWRHLLVHTSWTTCGCGKFITQTIQQWKDQYRDIYSFTLPGQHVVVVSLSLTVISFHRCLSVHGGGGHRLPGQTLPWADILLWQTPPGRNIPGRHPPSMF